MKKSGPRQALYGAALLSIAVLLGAAVSVVLAEVAARLLFPENVPATERVVFFRYDALLGWSQRPGQRVRFVQRDFSVDVSINALGLRDDEYPVRRRESKRMLVLGDSFAWGFGVEHAERFTEILERRHPGWEIINAAVNGYGTDQELLYLRDRGYHLDPDVVLLLFHPNDFANNLASEQYWYYKPHFVVSGADLVLRSVPVPRATISQQMRRTILGRTYLGQALLRLRRAVFLPDPSPTDDRDHASDSVAGGVLAARLLLEIDGICRRHGARLILVSTPMGEGERAVLDAVASAADIPYLALDAAFGGASADRHAVTFPHDEHWNAYGHLLAAQSIGEFLDGMRVFSVPGAAE